jgi:hypothetical protein
MNAILYNYQNSAIKPYEEDMALKAAYIFVHSMVATGDSGDIAYFSHNCSDDATVKRQLLLIETTPFHEPEWIKYVAAIPEVRKQLKRWNDIKHPTKKMLVARKKVLDSIKSNYLIVRNYMLDNYSRRAYLLLGDLLTQENYNRIYSDHNNPELHDDTNTSLSHVMQIAISKEYLEVGCLFFLTDNFFSARLQRPYHFMKISKA